MRRLVASVSRFAGTTTCCCSVSRAAGRLVGLPRLVVVGRVGGWLVRGHGQTTATVFLARSAPVAGAERRRELGLELAGFRQFLGDVGAADQLAASLLEVI